MAQFEISLKMKKFPNLLSLITLAATLAACTNAPSVKSAGCSAESIDQATDPSALRGIAAECSSSKKAELFALAISKLNDLPPVVGKLIQLQAVVPLADSEQVAFEIDVYFSPLEAYLPKSGMEKLATFVEKLNSTYSIRSVRLVGSAERAENALASFQFAHKRAEFVKRYLLAAGMQRDVPVEVLESNPKQLDTQEGRAVDRSVAIKVIAYRRRAGAKG